MTAERVRRGGGRLAGFPWFGLVIPLAVSLVLWLVTGSGTMLLFGLLGPVAMIASLVDGRRHQRLKDHDGAVAEQRRRAREERERAHQDESEAHLDRRRHPSLTEIVAAGLLPPGRPASSWRIGLDARGRPVLLEPHNHLWLVFEDPESTWSLAIERSLRATRAWSCHGDSGAHIVRGSASARPPVDASHSLRISSSGEAFLSPIDAPLVETLVRPDVLGRAEMPHIERLLSARDRGPTVVPGSLVDLLPGEKALVGVLGYAEDARPKTFHLVDDGPHMLVSGPTGSGKTEFIVSLLASLAASSSPSECQFAIIDFKGGGGFARVRHLRHCRGIATDLDPGEVVRAFIGFAAELRRRERILAESRETDVARVGRPLRPPRLVIVVDEFRALVEQLPEARRAIVDMMARGRALGVHVVLANQRASGAFGDDVVINAATRICLSPVADDDAWLMLGVPVRDLVAPGRATRRALMRDGTGAVTTVSPMLTDQETLDLAGRHDPGDHGDDLPLWWPPLPADLLVLPDGSLPVPSTVADTGSGLVLGLSASPETTAWCVERWNVATSPGLHIAGSARSGRTTLLTSLGVRVGADAAWLPQDAIASYDEVTRWCHLPDTDLPRSVFADNLDRLWAELPDEWQDNYVRMWTALIPRVVDRGGCVAVVTGPRVSGLTPALKPLTARIDLGDPESSGDSRSGSPRLGPGSGRWGDRPFQAVRLDPTCPAWNAERGPLPTLRVDSVDVILSSREGVWRSAGFAAFSPEEWLGRRGVEGADLPRLRVGWDGLARAQARLVGLDPTTIPPPQRGTVTVLIAADGHVRYQSPLEGDSSGA